MAKVYISYDPSSAILVRGVADTLRKSGHIVFIDVDVLQAGDDWVSVLGSKLAESDACISIMSRRYLENARGLGELSTAAGYAGASRRFLLLPVLVEDIEPPAFIGRFQILEAKDSSPDRVAADVAALLDQWLGSEIAKRKRNEEDHARIAKGASDYVRKSLDALKLVEDRYKTVAAVCYSIGAVSLLCSVGTTLYRLIKIHSAPGAGAMTVANAVELGLVYVVLIAVLIGFAKYMFTLGQSYMTEALRNADRVHAISFGEFYLNAFQEDAVWGELKEAFQHWNIDRGSSFLTQSARDFDPGVLEKALDVSKLVVPGKG